MARTGNGGKGRPSTSLNDAILKPVSGSVSPIIIEADRVCLSAGVEVKTLKVALSRLSGAVDPLLGSLPCTLQADIAT